VNKMIDYRRKPKVKSNILKIVYEAVILIVLLASIHGVLLLIANGVI